MEVLKERKHVVTNKEVIAVQTCTTQVYMRENERLGLHIHPAYTFILSKAKLYLNIYHLRVSPNLIDDDHVLFLIVQDMANKVWRVTRMAYILNAINAFGMRASICMRTCVIFRDPG